MNDVFVQLKIADVNQSLPGSGKHVQDEEWWV